MGTSVQSFGLAVEYLLVFLRPLGALHGSVAIFYKYVSFLEQRARVV